MSAKADIRAQMLAKRMQLTSAEKQETSEQLKNQIATWLKSEISTPPPLVVGGYMAVKGELDLGPTLKILTETGHTTALPCVEGQSKQLVFRRYQPEDALTVGAYNIQQPAISSEIVQPDILLVPLVAADIQMHRLGYGGGYYDVTIAQMKKTNAKLITVGIAHDFQLLDSLPAEAHDVALNYVMTPTRKLSA